MKSVYKIFAVILAAGLTVMSCDKKPINEDIPVVNPGGDENDPKDGPRVITVSFNTKATRTDLDEDTWTPSFQENDVIMVTDGNVEERCQVYFDGEYARINITKESLKNIDVTAVYPESAYIGTSPYFKVPSVQDGTFANANICKTTIKANETKAKFYNQTAVFRIELPDAGDKINYDEILALTVSSLGKIVNGHRGDTRSRIANDPIDSYTITLPRVNYDDDGPYNNPLYVSVLCDGDNSVFLSDLNFDIQYYHNYEDEEKGATWRTVTSMGGFSPKFLTDNKLDPKTATVQAGAIYTGVEDHLHEYINFGQVKWATMNVGATSTDRSSPDSYGLYFAWGETTGHKWNATVGDGKFEPINDGTSYSFTWGNGYLSQSLSDDIKKNLCPQLTANKRTYNVLSLDYDAAYQNWGGAWRIPRYDETLYPSGMSYSVIDFIAYSPRGNVDFANVGYGDGTSRTVTTQSSYWTSTLYSDNSKAYYVSVDDNRGIIQTYYRDRYIGHVIRPVSGIDDD